MQSRPSFILSGKLFLPVLEHASGKIKFECSCCILWVQMVKMCFWIVLTIPKISPVCFALNDASSSYLQKAANVSRFCLKDELVRFINSNSNGVIFSSGLPIWCCMRTTRRSARTSPTWSCLKATSAESWTASSKRTSATEASSLGSQGWWHRSFYSLIGDCYRSSLVETT